MSVAEVFLVFLRLGLTSFGGPVAHIGYFHDEFVLRRKWISEQAYADLVALCQFLPGPASSQVGMALGLNRAGIFGAVVAWLGFTLPSAFILVMFAFGVMRYQGHLQESLLHSLKVVAVAVVAQALWGMFPKLCPDKERITIALFAALATLAFPHPLTQVAVIILGGGLGVVLLKKNLALRAAPLNSRLSKKTATSILAVFFLLLILLPFAAETLKVQGLQLFDSFYRAGSLVFGGGHVVLPLLQSEVVLRGWVTNDVFMAGYGAAQAIPGPLLTFAAYLGAVSNFSPSGWIGAIICLLAIFLPSFLLVLGVLPFWQSLREQKLMRQALLGINAAVVGLLLSAFYNPVWTSGIHNTKDFVIAIVAFTLLAYARIPSWAVVLVTVAAGGLWL